MDYLDSEHQDNQDNQDNQDAPDAAPPSASVVLTPQFGQRRTMKAFPPQLVYTQLALVIAVVAGLFVAGAYVSERKTSDRWMRVAEQSQENLTVSQASEQQAAEDLEEAQRALAELEDADKTIKDLEKTIRTLQESLIAGRDQANAAGVTLRICLDYQRELIASTASPTTVTGTPGRDELLGKLAVACTQALDTVDLLTK